MYLHAYHYIGTVTALGKFEFEFLVILIKAKSIIKDLHIMRTHCTKRPRVIINGALRHNYYLHSQHHIDDVEARSIFAMTTDPITHNYISNAYAYRLLFHLSNAIISMAAIVRYVDICLL